MIDLDGQLSNFTDKKDLLEAEIGRNNGKRYLLCTHAGWRKSDTCNIYVDKSVGHWEVQY